MKNNIKSYSELICLKSFKERFEYAKLFGTVGGRTYGGYRRLNQILYTSEEWKRTRRSIVIRDNGCIFGLLDHPIYGKVYIHHLNPITMDDILHQKSCVFDPENLICLDFNTHNAVHYSNYELVNQDYKPRLPGDTCPWRC